MRDFVTFALAYLGYVMLCLDVVRRTRGSVTRSWTLALTAVVVAHVAMVWAWRFDWSLSYALDKSLPGFAIFHGALLLIVAGAVLPARHATRALLAAFVVVSSGALPAPFRYDEIAVLALPMFAAFAPTALVLAGAYLRRRSHSAR